MQDQVWEFMTKWGRIWKRTNPFRISRASNEVILGIIQAFLTLSDKIMLYFCFQDSRRPAITKPWKIFVTSQNWPVYVPCNLSGDILRCQILLDPIPLKCKAKFQWGLVGCITYHHHSNKLLWILNTIKQFRLCSLGSKILICIL